MNIHIYTRIDTLHNIYEGEVQCTTNSYHRSYSYPQSQFRIFYFYSRLPGTVFYTKFIIMAGNVLNCFFIRVQIFGINTNLNEKKTTNLSLTVGSGSVKLYPNICACTCMYIFIFKVKRQTYR